MSWKVAEPFQPVLFGQEVVDALVSKLTHDLADKVFYEALAFGGRSGSVQLNISQNFQDCEVFLLVGGPSM